MTKQEFKDIVLEAIKKQSDYTLNWHKQDILIDIKDKSKNKDFLDIVLTEHCCNFKLWHVEDKARRKDVPDKVIADCKRKIDKLNQLRNDWMEQIDLWVLKNIKPYLPDKNIKKYNSETIGSILDRLSILSLKIYHMYEQTLRTDVDKEHIISCKEKLAVLEEQHVDLKNSLLDLIDDYYAGIKVPKVYFQFKMYNDPNLNPELYKHK